MAKIVDSARLARFWTKAKQYIDNHSGLITSAERTAIGKIGTGSLETESQTIIPAINELVSGGGGITIEEHTETKGVVDISFTPTKDCLIILFPTTDYSNSLNTRLIDTSVTPNNRIVNVSAAGGMSYIRALSANHTYEIIVKDNSSTSWNSGITIHYLLVS